MPKDNDNDEFPLEYSTWTKRLMIILPAAMAAGGTFLVVFKKMEVQGFLLVLLSALYCITPMFRAKKLVKNSNKILIVKSFRKNAPFPKDEIYRTDNNRLQIGSEIINLNSIKNPDDLIEFLGAENIHDMRKGE